MRSSNTSGRSAASSGSAASWGGDPSDSVRRSQQNPAPEGMPDRRSSQGPLAPRSQLPQGHSVAQTSTSAPWQRHDAPSSAAPQSSGGPAAGFYAESGASPGRWSESQRAASSAGLSMMQAPSTTGSGQGYGGAASGSGIRGSWAQSLREGSSGGPSTTPPPGGGASAPLPYSMQEAGTYSAADSSSAPRAGSRSQTSAWSRVKDFWSGSGSRNRTSSVSLQQPYSQASALEAHESTLRNRDDYQHDRAWDQGICSGVAAEWAIDRVHHADSSTEERLARLGSEQGVRSAVSTQRTGHDHHLIGALRSLGGSAMNAQRTSMSAMLEPRGVSLDGEPSQFRLSRRGSTRSIATAISAPGLSLINVYDMQSRQGPSRTAGHMVSAYSDGSRIELFDGNQGEFHADVSDAKTLVKSVLDDLSDTWKMDKVLVQRLAPSEAGSES